MGAGDLKEVCSSRIYERKLTQYALKAVPTHTFAGLTLESALELAGSSDDKPILAQILELSANSLYETHNNLQSMAIGQSAVSKSAKYVRGLCVVVVSHLTYIPALKPIFHQKKRFASGRVCVTYK